MFDLEKAIADWRRQLIQSGLKSRDALDELESHLRDDITRRFRSGCDIKGAFEEAARQLGESGALETEFSKLKTDKASSLPIIFRVTCFLAAPLMLISGMSVLWDDQLGFMTRVPGLILVFVAALYIAALPFYYRRLPEVDKKWFGADLKLTFVGFIGWVMVALLGALGILHLRLGNIFLLVGWSLYVTYVCTVLAVVGRDLERVVDSVLRIEPSRDDFTEAGWQSVQCARDEAQRLRHSFIGTEHLLLGVLLTESYVLMDALRDSEIDYRVVRNEIERFVGMGFASQPCMTHHSYTPRVKKAFSLAAREARAMNYSTIAPEHLFWACWSNPQAWLALFSKNWELISEKCGRESNPVSDRTVTILDARRF